MVGKVSGWKNSENAKRIPKKGLEKACANGHETHGQPTAKQRRALWSRADAR